MTKREWISGQYDSFMNYMSKVDHYAINKFWIRHEPYVRIGNFIIEISSEKRTTLIMNTKNGKYAIVHCYEYDLFARWYGLGLCWAKYMHRIPPKLSEK